MKRITLLTLLLTLASGSLGNAQLKHFGVKLGGTSADVVYHIDGSDDRETVRRLGLGIAAFAEWFDHSPVTLLTQVEYVQKGAGMDIDYPHATSQYDRTLTYERKREYIRLDYLSIPVFGKATFTTGSFSPYVLAGLRVDFLLGYVNQQPLLSNLYQNFEKTLFGATLGAGTQIDDLLPVPLMLEARYNLDLTYSYERTFEGRNMKVFNNSFDLWLGVAF